jgi:subtilisin
MRARKAFLLILLVALVSASVATSAIAESASDMIVVFKPGVSSEKVGPAIIARHGGIVGENLRLINARAARLTPAAARALAKDPSVLRVDEDIVVSITRGGPKQPTQPAETLPWGIDRIDAELAWARTTADPVKVAVLDTGIDLSHPDLAANIKGGYNALNPLKQPSDGNGHGTHVAGIIAALDNDIGVVGAAPAADLYAVKVLGNGGSGKLSDVIEGLDWAVAHGMQVVNMSFGASSGNESFHAAIIAAHNAGIVLVAAAGNEGGPVSYPAAYPEVIAVSAIDSSDAVPSWSNFGPEIDLAASGVSIFSTYKGPTYQTLSGTSMASPHVAGASALVMSLPVPPAYDTDGDGSWDPAELQQRLQDTAEDRGPSGFDPYYGSGVVNAYSALP